MGAEGKKYEPLQIPARRPSPDGQPSALPKSGENPPSGDGLFYEIDYDASPIEGVGKYVLKPEPIRPPSRDALRDRFYQMRELARREHLPFLNASRFYDQRVQRENARIFYKQAVFMADLEDDYPDEAPFSAYFPDYQRMGYEQLRTYFTWRARVRRGEVRPIPLSYGFLYIYELLNNIGVADPQEGLERLMDFWLAFRAFEPDVDKYVPRWLRDYHIYYPLDHTFREFAESRGLTERYPELAGQGEPFARLCSLSRYDVRRSGFFAGETAALLAEGILRVMGQVRGALQAAGIALEGSLFYPVKQNAPWTPFKGALFHDWLRQPDRKIQLSEDELYLCSGHKWYRNTALSTDKGRRLVGYVMKETEAVLRRAMHYKYKLTANVDSVDPGLLAALQKAGLSLETIVEQAALAYYREATKVVVAVDASSLNRIRQEAMATQAALTVEEEPAPPPVYAAVELTPALPDSGWDALREALSDAERAVLASLLRGESLAAVAARQGMMPEVLADGINEKAVDTVGDSLLDGELALYEDYLEPVKGMLEGMVKE